MLSVGGNDGTEDEMPPAYETEFNFVQSKRYGIRRINFQDTDNNKTDTQAADYKADDVSSIFPRCVANGEWGNEDERTIILREIEEAKARLPRFYAAYCTESTAQALTEAITTLDDAVSSNADADTLESLLDAMRTAGAGLVFKSDVKVPQVYIATDKGNGESYGTGLTKAIGYVPAQVTVIDAGGAIITSDHSWGTQVKVRGNSTANGAKKPYNVKFSSKIDLFGMGEAKKWSLLADLYDPTLMRNRIALTLGASFDLEATSANHRVEVWMDGQYRGIYLLTEKIDAINSKVKLKAKNGDFLIETVVKGEEEEGNIYLTSASGQKFRLREPEDEMQIEAVKAKIDDFEEIISSGTWEEVSEVIDLNSMVAYFILNEYIRTYDWGWPKSVYFYCKDGKFHGGPAWDFDYSSGNTSGSVSATGVFVGSKIYYKYLTKFPEFMSAVYKKFWKICRSGELENLYKTDGFIDSEIAFYFEAISRNNAIWKVSDPRPSWNRVPDETYEENVEFLRTWLKDRNTWMMTYYVNGVFEDDDGIYYYVNNQKTSAGFIEYDGNYYYAGENGKISVGNFNVNGNPYSTDSSGKILLQSLALSLSDQESLETESGTEASLALTASVAASYGEGLTKTLTSSQYSLTWSVSPQISGITLSSGTLTVNSLVKPGNYQLTVTAEASSGEIQTSEQMTITVNVHDSGVFIPDDPAKPEFAYQSLILEGQIGVNFYMYLPEIDGIDYMNGSQCYMDFDVSGDKSSNPNSCQIDPEFTLSEAGVTYYGFKCRINSLQMADKITAVFHYGENSITKTYSAKQYLDHDFSTYSETTQNLITAIKDYGHYSQIMLAEKYGFKLGKDYAEMEKGRDSDYTADEIHAASADVKDYAIINGNSEGSGVESIEYSLNLDSSTAINLYLNMSEGYVPEAFMNNGSTSIADRVSAGRYKVVIDEISAHKLGTYYTVRIKAAKTFNVKISALSYANAVLNNHTDNQKLCNAVTALYKYYKATLGYRAASGYAD